MNSVSDSYRGVRVLPKNGNLNFLNVVFSAFRLRMH